MVRPRSRSGDPSWHQVSSATRLTCVKEGRDTCAVISGVAVAALGLPPVYRPIGHAAGHDPLIGRLSAHRPGPSFAVHAPGRHSAAVHTGPALSSGLAAVLATGAADQLRPSAVSPPLACDPCVIRAHGSGVRLPGLANLCLLPAWIRSLVVARVGIIPRIIRIMAVRGPRPSVFRPDVSQVGRATCECSALLPVAVAGR